jgi:hypothetical protein
MAGQPFRAGLTTRWVPMKGFRSFHSPFPSFAWRTENYTVSAPISVGVLPLNDGRYLRLVISLHFEQVPEGRRLKVLKLYRLTISDSLKRPFFAG